MYKLRRDNLDELVYQKVKEMILTGVLRAGEPIVQSRLAEQLGVSRTPLRKALTQLEKEGLVAADNGRVSVRDFSLEELCIVFEIRAAVEGVAARLAAQRSPDLKWLDEMRRAYLNAYQNSDFQLYRSVDVEFHSGLARRSNVEILTELTNNLCVLSISLARGLIRGPAQTIDEHLAIIDALEKRESERAEFMVKEHIHKSLEYLRCGLN